MICLHCRQDRPTDLFHLGRARGDGHRYPVRYCGDCWEGARPLNGGGREARKRANRESRRRMAMAG